MLRNILSVRPPPIFCFINVASSNMIIRKALSMVMLYITLISMQIQMGSGEPRRWYDVLSEIPVFNETEAKIHSSYEYDPLLFLVGSYTTEAPVIATEEPSAGPSFRPSSSPSAAPSSKPSASPSSIPSYTPTSSPSSTPSNRVKVIPRLPGNPTVSPSSPPSSSPSSPPSSSPSLSPSLTPTSLPSSSPLASPSLLPSAQPSISPTTSIEPSLQTPLTQAPTKAVQNVNGNGGCAQGEMLFELVLYGSNGWNGAMIGIAEGRQASRYHFVGTLESGDVKSYGICLKKEICYQVLVTKGFFPQSIGWEIRWVRLGHGLTRDFIAKGGAPTECTFSVWDTICLNTCEPDGFPKSISELTLEPTIAPSRQPTTSPSAQPTTSPSQKPSLLSSSNPSQTPSIHGSTAPSQLLTEPKPKFVLGEETFIPNPTPSNPPARYFNYDNRKKGEGGGYGPGQKKELGDGASFKYVNNYWKDLNAKNTHESKYWEKYQEYLPQDFSRNHCGDNDGKQSPIDLVQTDKCVEFHEIRHRAGDFRMDDVEVQKLILPSKLRIKYPDRTGKEPDVPSADIPLGWEKQMDILHIDIKIPSEHTIAGKRFAAEYQMFLLSKKTDRGIPVVSVLMDFDPKDKDNDHFQKVLDAFQIEYDNDLKACSEKLKSQRFLKNNTFVGDEDLNEYNAFDTLTGKSIDEDLKIHLQRRHLADPKTSKGKWDPWKIGEILRSIWFYGYKGSLTEPPCSPGVHWRVIDVPMLISKIQLKQMKRLLFDHINANCKATSVQSGGSVARPIQQSTSSNIWRCSCENYISDADRDILNMKTCLGR